MHKTQARSSTLVKLAEFFKMPLWQFIQESGVAVSADDGYGWQIVGGVKSRFRYDEENTNRPYPIQLVFRNLRIMNGWSIPALASKAGISQNTLRRWELGWGVGVSPEWEAKLIQIMQMGFQRVQECLLKIYSSAESVFDWITAKREYLRKVKSLSLEEVFRPHLFRAAT
ncbi:helix-turn-helix transcriptional regulator [Candidatus Gottesmanbacteria bacterium]|nr:helix-turn-helix transcriptional regulator [Candidatus Gottesmanbacteria bacterium]